MKFQRSDKKAVARRHFESMQNIPTIFLDRIQKLGILSLFFLISGIFFGIRWQNAGFFVWSVFLSVAVGIQALVVFRDAVKGRYEMVTGIVEEIKKGMPGQFQNLKVCQKDGSYTELLLSKKLSVEQGKRYRFYFREKNKTLLGIRQVDAMFDTGSFLGLEKIRDNQEIKDSMGR
ncbi:hypothetical protein [Parablautia sp. Marseille-Q6255]|uniref:hypothetical protein n=1 Tax=Parablautia sp. Marseille-Q6255 TaxID=3039593 RepID=UPI0024BCC08E|nr:hypothetical protein [Parablautia sp. Marseille-Q6255]